MNNQKIFGVKLMVNIQYPPSATPLDPDEMEGLKIKHIATHEELNRFEQDNINEALQWLGIRHKGDVLTEKFVKTLHQKMFGKVWSYNGPKNLDHQKQNQRYNFWLTKGVKDEQRQTVYG